MNRQSGRARTGWHDENARAVCFAAPSHAKPGSTFAECACSNRLFAQRRCMTTPSFMDLALKAAETAGKSGEVPIRCAIVRDNEVITAARNRNLSELDINAHA